MSSDKTKQICLWMNIYIYILEWYRLRSIPLGDAASRLCDYQTERNHQICWQLSISLQRDHQNKREQESARARERERERERETERETEREIKSLGNCFSRAQSLDQVSQSMALSDCQFLAFVFLRPTVRVTCSLWPCVSCSSLDQIKKDTPK